MEEPLEILFVAFCGVVLTFALLFVACWCIISCSFFCLKYIYCSNLNKLVSALTVGSSSLSENDNSDESDLEMEADDCSICSETVSHHHRNRRVVVGHSHTHDTANQLEGYLVENSAETGSTGKVTPEDVPPLYDSPPDYHSLFPTTSKEAQQKLILDDMRIVNEVLSLVTSATTSAPSFNHDDEQGYSQPTNGTGTSV
ncbi:uncharacterized protein LOC110852473 isoform X1 [Folsomia candida]|nr:uncharacterized protein LOC110852473 isoform X1 [Folsomia candida]